MNLKKCSKCGAEKPDTTEFFRHKYRVRLSGMCKECDKKYGREQYHKNKFLKSQKPVFKEEKETHHKVQKEAVKRTPTDHGTVLVTFGDKFITPRREIRSSGLMGYQSSLANNYD